MVRALGLFSGGLDSLLAAKMLMLQGIEVTALTFTTPFFGAEKAQGSSKSLGIKLMVVDISEPHFEILKAPQFGYGKNFNPCMDCHALMIRIAGKIMEEQGYDFIFTGEVLGQRPFSQNRKSLLRIAEASGYHDYLLRPLSAKLLKETLAEKNGLVDRELLENMSGRSRRRQFALAKKWGIARFAKTGGGCVLTEPGFSLRLREAFRDNPNLTPSEVYPLRLGRHFRISDTNRLIVGKDQADNENLARRASESQILVKIPVIPGPTALVISHPTEEDFLISARIVARYADTDPSQTYGVEFWSKDKMFLRVVFVTPYTIEESDYYLLQNSVDRRSEK